MARCALHDFYALRFVSGDSLTPRHALKSCNAHLAVDYPLHSRGTSKNLSILSLVNMDISHSTGTKLVCL